MLSLLYGSCVVQQQQLQLLGVIAMGGILKPNPAMIDWLIDGLQSSVSKNALVLVLTYFWYLKTLTFTQLGKLFR